MIANEFGEATGVHRSALFACGLVLFVLTLFVNLIARFVVNRAGRSERPSKDDAGPEAIVEAAVQST